MGIDTDASTRKKRIANIFKVLFPQRNAIPVPKEARCDGFVRLLYYISYNHLTIAMDQILELLGYNSQGSSKGAALNKNITIHPKKKKKTPQKKKKKKKKKS